MTRQIELVLVRKKVRAVATLLEEEAPRTCAAVWAALPLEGDTYHAKWAGRELYTLVPPLGSRPGEENATITPIPGDVLYFDVPPDTIDLPVALRRAHPQGLVDIAVFYGRNNLLLGPAGFMPGNLFATITKGLDAYAKACHELFREGTINERFVIRRVEAQRRAGPRDGAGSRR
ncbi:MAG: DUF3830 family protein [Candidatus Rokubacteria bacterium]|nr:DUF3830 family protein [Candidatus Rokubacteria bacterium]